MTQYMVHPLISGRRPIIASAHAPVTRFAPSPNGPLHVGHAWAAIMAHDFARAHGGRFQLRIEDIDGTRSRAEHVGGIVADVEWLGLTWDGPVIFQSQRVENYRVARDRLIGMGLLYRCTCSRADIAEAARDGAAGPDGPVYPGTCRGQDRPGGEPHSWRIDMAAAIRMAETKAGGSFGWHDLEAGEQRADPARFGDIILWRKDAPASYHLGATVDDAADGISHVVRGRDLFAHSPVHRLLQILLDLPQPQYWHHSLLVDDMGQKLSKSRASAALAGWRNAGEDGRLFAQNLRSGILPLGISVSGA